VTRRTKVGLGVAGVAVALLGLRVWSMISLPPADLTKTFEGTPAPAFALASTAGVGTTTLPDLLKGKTAAVLVFYRGDW
jgi:hypothetical protein